MRTSRMGAVTIGLAALALALTGSGIIAMLFSVYTIFTSGMLMPVIGGFYTEKLGLTTFGSADCLGWRWPHRHTFGKELSAAGLGCFCGSVDLRQLARPQARKGWTCDARLTWRVLGIFQVSRKSSIFVYMVELVFGRDA
jgi:Na+/proline symporter